MKHIFTHAYGQTPQIAPGRKSAFTLIELLVVIAIIAILSALLFPSLSRSLAKGREVVCRSNLRQIGVGVMLYVSDNEDMMPPKDPVSWVIDGVTVGYPKFSDFIAPYLQKKAASGTVWKCPEDRRDNKDCSYGINVNAISASYGIASPYPYPNTERLSEIILLSDSSTWGSGSDREIFWGPKSGVYNANMEFRHLRRRSDESVPPTPNELDQTTATILFYDSHVEARTYDSLTHSNYFTN